MSVNVLLRTSRYLFRIGLFLSLAVAALTLPVSGAGADSFTSFSPNDYLDVFCGKPLYGPRPVTAPVVLPPHESAMTVPVSIINFGYEPQEILINVGDTVRWTNNDFSSHTATSDNGVWNSGTLSHNQTFSFTFTTPGTFPYHCTFHGFMTGNVIVSGPSPYSTTTLALSTNTTVAASTAPVGATSLNVSTSTDFKGKLEAEPTTGLVHVTDAHPAGTYTVTVKQFNGDTLSAIYTFTLAVTTPVTCDPVSFATATNFATGTAPNSVAVGDFNGDGKQDLATANVVTANVSILLGDGAGGFSAPTNFVAGPDATSVAVGDLNGDGKQDLVTANYNGGSGGAGRVALLLGNGAGSFGAASTFLVGNLPTSVVVGDFNGDAKQDVATTNESPSGTVSVLLGNGAGSFNSAIFFPVGALPRSAVVGDFDGNGKQDLAVASSGTNNVSILLGDGSGSFNPATNAVVGAASNSVVVSDLNGDNKQDLAVATNGGVSILLGNGAGGFGSAANSAAGSAPISIAAGDFNADGEPDLAVANSNSNQTSLLFGDGTGSFTSPISFDVGNNPLSLAVGDFNGNGAQDLAVTNLNPGGSSSVSILLRNCGMAPKPSISGTVTYGNAIGAPTPRFVSNVLITGAGSPTVSVETAGPGPNAGTYTLTGFGALSYTVTPTKTTGQNSITSFDAARIAQHVTAIAPLTGNQLIVADVSGNGMISSFDAGQVALYVAAVSGSGSTGNWIFSPTNRTYSSISGSITGEDYSALLMGEVSGNWTNSGGRPANSSGPGRAIAVSVPHLATSAEKEVVIPIAIDGVGNKDIIAYEFNLRYDPLVIIPQSDPVDLAGAVSRGFSYVTNTEVPGILRVVMYGAMPLDHKGVLLNLRFTAVGAPGSISPLAWERVMFNEGEPRVITADGSVELSADPIDSVARGPRKVE